MQCYHHDGAGGCRRNRVFAKYGGEERLIFILKTWCVLGSAVAPGDDSAAQHKEIPDVDDQWADAELDAAYVVPLEGQLSKRRKL